MPTVNFDDTIDDEPVSVEADIFVEYGLAYCDGLSIFDEWGADITLSADAETQERLIQRAIEESEQ